MIGILFRGLLFTWACIILSPVVVPGLIIGLLVGALRAAYLVGYKGVTYFLLTWTVRKNATQPAAGGVAWGRSGRRR
jgi:hypothetical protein